MKVKDENSDRDGNAQTNESTVAVQQKRNRILFVSIFTLIVILFSSIYLLNERNRYLDYAASEAISLAKSVEAVIPHDYINKLTGNADDLSLTKK